MITARLLLSAAKRISAASMFFGSRPSRARVAVNLSSPRAQPTGSPAISARTRSRTKSGCANASNKSPVEECWRTRASAWAACALARSSPQSSASGKKYSCGSPRANSVLREREEPRAASTAPAAEAVERHGRGAALLTCEPALGGEVARHDVALELRDEPCGGGVTFARGRGVEAREAVEQHEPGLLLGREPLLVPARHVRGFRELEPIEPVAREREHVRQLADRRERRAAEQLDGHAAAELREIELDGLRRAFQVRDAQQSSRFRSGGRRRGSCGCPDAAARTYRGRTHCSLAEPRGSGASN